MNISNQLDHRTVSLRIPTLPLGTYLFEALERRLQLSASLSLSGTQTITPSSVVNASADSSAWQSEMSVTVDPTNPLRVAAFSHRFQTNYTADRIDVFYSIDGGANWTVNATATTTASAPGTAEIRRSPSTPRAGCTSATAFSVALA